MTKPPLMLDTCALRNKDLLKKLKSYTGTKRISAIAYAEFSSQMLKRYPQDRVRKMLDDIGIKIIPFEMSHATSAANIMYESCGGYYCKSCGNTNWNDCFIAAQVGIAPNVLVTENVKDFYSILDASRVKTPQEIITMIGMRRK